MKKTILITLFALLGVTQMVAQEHEYIPFVREGVKWVCSYAEVPSHKTFTYRLELKGDVEINGKTYKAMHKYSGEEINWEDDTIPVYLREEGRVVYGIVPDGKTYRECPVGIGNEQALMDIIASGEEFILYDFNKPVEFIESWITIPDYISHKVLPDMTLVAGKKAKRYISWYESTAFCLIDGIGYDGLWDAYPLAVICSPSNGIPPVWLNHVEENGEVIYSSESQKPQREYIPKIPREGVQWVNECVVIDHGVISKYFYTYEFKGASTAHDHPICYQYTGDKLDESTAEVAAVFRTPYDDVPRVTECIVANNKPLAEVQEQGRCTMNFYGSEQMGYNLYSFSENYSEIETANTVNYYIILQKEDFLNRENFIEVEPLEIEGMECRRFAYIGEDGDPIAYITEGIGFDSRDMGDLLTPFTAKPDPTADHQEYWGLSHVIKDGEIIYKGMRYDESLFGGVAGDVNGDGRLTIGDVTCLIDLLLQGNVTFRQSADLDGNGSLTIRDVTALIDLLLSDNN